MHTNERRMHNSAPVAQGIEHSPSKRAVTGSNPVGHALSDQELVEEIGVQAYPLIQSDLLMVKFCSLQEEVDQKFSKLKFLNNENFVYLKRRLWQDPTTREAMLDELINFLENL